MFSIRLYGTKKSFWLESKELFEEVRQKWKKGELFNDQEFHQKLLKHQEKSVKLMGEMREHDKKQNDKDKKTHANFKVYEFKLSPSRFIIDLIAIYFIFDHWFGEKKLYNFLTKNEQQQTKSE